MNIDIAAIRALCEATTPGPWRQEYAYNNGGCPTANFYIPGHNGGATVEMLANDAAFIVAARTALPELLARLEAAERERDDALADGVLSQRVCDIENDLAQSRTECKRLQAEAAKSRETTEIIMALVRDDIERDTAEHIAAWLESKARVYKEKHDHAIRNATNDQEPVEFGWAASYADGFAANIRAGRYRSNGGGE
jgi:hypothetical protein